MGLITVSTQVHSGQYGLHYLPAQGLYCITGNIDHLTVANTFLCCFFNTIIIFSFQGCLDGQIGYCKQARKQTQKELDSKMREWKLGVRKWVIPFLKGQSTFIFRRFARDIVNSFFILNIISNVKLAQEICTWNLLNIQRNEIFSKVREHLQKGHGRSIYWHRPYQ